MAPRPPIQAVIEEQAELDTGRRNWRMVLFNEDGTPFTGGGGGSSVGSWVNIPLINGWASYSGRTPQYRIEDGGKTIRLRGTIDGVSKTDEVFMDWPAGLIETETHGGLTGFNPGVGYGSGELATDADGFHAWVAQQCAFLDGVTVGLD